jgi:hypothetical protein
MTTVISLTAATTGEVVIDPRFTAEEEKSNVGTAAEMRIIAKNYRIFRSIQTSCTLVVDCY